MVSGERGEDIFFFFFENWSKFACRLPWLQNVLLTYWKYLLTFHACPIHSDSSGLPPDNCRVFHNCPCRRLWPLRWSRSAVTQMELRTHSFLRFPAHVWLKWLRRFESDIPTYSTVFRSLWCESKLERVIVAGCGKVFLESLAYAILMSFVFSLLHVETIGGCTALWCFKEQRCLCPLNERFKFLATTLEGWNLMAVIVPVY